MQELKTHLVEKIIELFKIEDASLYQPSFASLLEVSASESGEDDVESVASGKTDGKKDKQTRKAEGKGRRSGKRPRSKSGDKESKKEHKKKDKEEDKSSDESRMSVDRSVASKKTKTKIV